MFGVLRRQSQRKAPHSPLITSEASFADSILPLRECLRYMGRPPDTRVLLPIAREVCERYPSQSLKRCSFSNRSIRLLSVVIVGPFSLGRPVPMYTEKFEPFQSVAILHIQQLAGCGRLRKFFYLRASRIYCGLRCGLRK
jgi:hypothetical protein